MKRFLLIALTVLFIGCNMETQDVKTLETLPASTPAANTINPDDYQDNPDGVFTFINHSSSIIQIKFATIIHDPIIHYGETIATGYIAPFETMTFTYENSGPLHPNFPEAFKKIKTNVYLFEGYRRVYYKTPSYYLNNKKE